MFYLQKSFICQQYTQMENYLLDNGLQDEKSIWLSNLTTEAIFELYNFQMLADYLVNNLTCDIYLSVRRKDFLNVD